MKSENINQKLATALSNRSLDVTDQAKRVLVLAIEAIETDKHPDWPTSFNVDMLQQDAIDTTIIQITRLANIIARHQKKDVWTIKITTFDILHTVWRWLDSACPFEKDRPSD